MWKIEKLRNLNYPLTPLLHAWSGVTAASPALAVENCQNAEKYPCQETAGNRVWPPMAGYWQMPLRALPGGSSILPNAAVHVLGFPDVSARDAAMLYCRAS